MENEKVVLKKLVNGEWCVEGEWSTSDIRGLVKAAFYLGRNASVVDDVKVNYDVKPKKTGHWIVHQHEAGPNWEYPKYECSECHTWTNDDSNYCPECGIEMEGE